jgi:galactokinase
MTAASVATVRDCFTNALGGLPEVFTRAPGRVEVLGNHTDYNEGYTLSCAIDREVFVALAKSGSPGVFELTSTQFPQSVKIRNVEPQKDNAWVNYPLGVYMSLKERGFPVGPFKIAIDSSIPVGAGLSSSAAVEVATGLSLAALFGFEIRPSELAQVCQHAENSFVGAKCGLLDQFSSIFGRKNHLLFMEYRNLEHEAVSIANADVAIAVTTSGVTHSLVASAYNDRRKECFGAADYFHALNPGMRTLRDVSMDDLKAATGKLDPLFLKRAMHPVGEDERVKKGMALLKKGDMKTFGNLLYESHESSRVNFENSCRELDLLVDIAHSVPGVYGSRLMGGGFGGATLTLLPPSVGKLFEKTIKREYSLQTGREATVHFAAIADGAQVVTQW